MFRKWQLLLMYIMSALTNMSFPPWRVSKPFTWSIYRESLSSLISWEVLMAYLITSWSSASPVCPPTSCHKALIFSKCLLEKLLLLWVTAQNYDDSHWGMLACPPLIGLQGLPSFAFETVFQRMADTSGLKFFESGRTTISGPPKGMYSLAKSSQWEHASIW